MAAHAAAEFFQHPAKTTLDKLVARAKKAKCADMVRAASLRFLETGVLPIQPIASRKGGKASCVNAAWPLPIPDYLVPLMIRERDAGRVPTHHFDVLLDMAIAKRPDEVTITFPV